MTTQHVWVATTHRDHGESYMVLGVYETKEAAASDNKPFSPWFECGDGLRNWDDVDEHDGDLGRNQAMGSYVMSIWSTTFHLEDATAPYSDFYEAPDTDGDAHYTSLDTLPETSRAGYLWFSEALGFGVPLIRLNAEDGEIGKVELFLDPTQAEQVRDHLDRWLKDAKEKVKR